MGRPPGRVRLVPLRVGAAPAVGGLAGAGQHRVLHDEVALGVEAEQPLGRGDLVRAECGAVGLAGVLLGGCGPADQGAQHDQRGPAVLVAGGAHSGQQGVHVLDVLARARPVDGLHVPAVGGEAGRDVLAEGDVGVVLDRDVVGVVEDDEVAQFLVAGEGGGLTGDAFHHVAVGGDDVDVVVEGAAARLGVGVEQTALPAGRHGHPDRAGQPLAQRAGGDLDAAGVPVLGVPGSGRTPGAVGLQVRQLQAVAGQVELEVQGQAGVPAGEDETVAAQPPVVGRVVPHDVLEQQMCQRGQAHRGAGMAVADLLHRVGGEHPYGVHRPYVDLVPPGVFRHGHRHGPAR